MKQEGEFCSTLSEWCLSKFSSAAVSTVSQLRWRSLPVRSKVIVDGPVSFDGRRPKQSQPSIEGQINGPDLPDARRRNGCASDNHHRRCLRLHLRSARRVLGFHFSVLELRRPEAMLACMPAMAAGRGTEPSPSLSQRSIGSLTHHPFPLLPIRLRNEARAEVRP